MGRAAVANNSHLAPKFSGGQVYYTSLIILSKSGPNRFSSSRENTKNDILRYGEREVLAITVLIQKSETVLFTEVEVCDVSNSCGK